MSWYVRYKIELRNPLTAELAKRISEFEPELSEFSSGFMLSRVVGKRTLEGSTQPSGGHRPDEDSGSAQLSASAAMPSLPATQKGFMGDGCLQFRCQWQTRRRGTQHLTHPLQ